MMKRALVNLINAIAFRIAVSAVIAWDRLRMDLLASDFAQTLQERALLDNQNTIADNAGTGSNFQDIFAPSTGNQSQMVNLLRNSDANISDAVYNSATYTTPDLAANVPAHAYAQANNVNTQIVPNSTTVESARAIRPILSVSDGSISIGSKNLVTVTPIFATGQTTGFTVWVQNAGGLSAPLITTMDTFTDSTHCVLHDAAVIGAGPVIVRVYPTGITTGWREDRGEIEWGGIDRLYFPLKKKYIAPGVANNIFTLALIRLNSDIGVSAIDPTHALRIGIWDNSTGIQDIVKGTTVTITGGLVSGSGAVTRHYVVKFITPTGFFFSNVASPLVVTSTPDPGSGSSGQVEINFPSIFGVTTVEVYRSDSVAGLSDFYRVDLVVTGITTVEDNGGRVIGPVALADQAQQAISTIADVGDRILATFVPLSARTITPSTYDVGGTTDGQQFLFFDIVDSTGTPVSVDPFSIRIDRFALSVSGPGVWAASSDDQAAPGDFASTGPDPSGSNPSGGGGDPGGGGKVGRQEDLPF